MDGLLNIEISDDEQEAKKAKRTGQTEEDFQAIRATYRPKVENGNVSFLSGLDTLLLVANLPPHTTDLQKYFTSIEARSQQAAYSRSHPRSRGAVLL